MKMKDEKFIRELLLEELVQEEVYSTAEGDVEVSAETQAVFKTLIAYVWKQIQSAAAREGVEATLLYRAFVEFLDSPE